MSETDLLRPLAAVANAAAFALMLVRNSAPMTKSVNPSFQRGGGLMKRFLLLGATSLLASCNSDSSASADKLSMSDHSTEDAKTSVDSSSAAMSLLNTSWEIGNSGTPMVISIDQAGAYIEERGDGTHVDHGTYAQRNGKDCFISAMGDKGTNCWTAVPQVEIGGTAAGTADDGNSGVFKRVDYRVLKLP